MTQSFDPYFSWLGLSPNERPFNHYRLLSVELLESNTSIIEQKANQTIEYVQQCGMLSHSAEAKQLVQELNSAKSVLLNPSQKSVYDSGLRNSLGLPAPANHPAPANPATANPATANHPSTPMHGVPQPIPTQPAINGMMPPSVTGASVNGNIAQPGTQSKVMNAPSPVLINGGYKPSQQQELNSIESPTSKKKSGGMMPIVVGTGAAAVAILGIIWFAQSTPSSEDSTEHAEESYQTDYSSGESTFGESSFASEIDVETRSKIANTAATSQKDTKPKLTLGSSTDSNKSGYQVRPDDADVVLSPNGKIDPAPIDRRTGLPIDRRTGKPLPSSSGGGTSSGGDFARTIPDQDKGEEFFGQPHLVERADGEEGEVMKRKKKRSTEDSKMDDSKTDDATMGKPEMKNSKDMKAQDGEAMKKDGTDDKEKDEKETDEEVENPAPRRKLAKL